MRARRRILIAVIALLAGAAVALPAAALSETAPSVEAVNEGGGIYGEVHRWAPAAVTVAPGASVTFSNASAVPHGIHWTGPVPACAEGVKVDTSGTHWSGACTFSKPGVYSFYCTVHGPSMSGTITVEAPATSPGTTTAASPSPYPTGTTTSPAGGGGGSTAPAASSTPSGGTLGGSRLLGVSERGGAVRGTVEVPGGGAGASAEIELLARGASLAGSGAKRRSLVVVARLRRSNLLAGRQSFSLRVDAKALHALRAHHRLAVVLRVALRAPASAAAGGPMPATLRLERSLLLRG